MQNSSNEKEEFQERGGKKQKTKKLKTMTQKFSKNLNVSNSQYPIRVHKVPICQS